MVRPSGCLTWIERSPAYGQVSPVFHLTGKLAAGETSNKVEIAFKEIEFRESAEVSPADLLEHLGLRLAAEDSNQEEQDMDAAAAWVIVFIAGQFGSHFGFDVQLLAELANERLLRRFAGLDFAAGKLPFQRVAIGFPSLAQQHASAAMDDRR